MTVETKLFGGRCFFCGGAMLKCDAEGDVDNPTEKWVICEDEDCMRGPIATEYYGDPWYCSDECERGDCDSCDNEPDCDGCDRVDPDEIYYNLDEIIKDVTNLTVMDSDGFHKKTIEEMKEEVESISGRLKDRLED